MQALPYDSVMDIGAGSGDDLKIALGVNPSAKAYAVEVNPVSAHSLAQHGVEVFNINIERQRIPLGDGTVDLVILNQVLEHIKDVYWVAHEISRLLPTGGKLIIGVPNLASLHNRLLLMFGRQPTSIKTNSAHVRGFTRGDLLQFFDEIFPGGYHLQGIRGANFYPFPPPVARLMAVAFPSLAWGMFLLLRKERDYHQEFLEAPIIEELETNFFVGRNEDRSDSRFSL
ncbi:MAG: methyltransferase domain-containing protein [Chloroflexi bacterium]|nr:methyltransferase domain-containing protein [Chloroflexota bacterium]